MKLLLLFAASIAFVICHEHSQSEDDVKNKWKSEFETELRVKRYAGNSAFQFCSAHRPGQRIYSSKVCDGIYDCLDRSDEDECGNMRVSKENRN
jgi:hypothetical protein